MATKESIFPKDAPIRTYAEKLSKMSFWEKQIEGLKQIGRFSYLLTIVFFGVTFVLVGVSLYGNTVSPNLTSTTLLTYVNSTVIGIAICIMGAYIAFIGLPRGLRLQGFASVLLNLFIFSVLAILAIFYASQLLPPIDLQSIINISGYAPILALITLMVYTARLVILWAIKDKRLLSTFGIPSN